MEDNTNLTAKINSFFEILVLYWM